MRRRDRICVGCGAEQGLSVHHVVPARLGGSDAMDNLVTLCSRCHAGAEAQARRGKRGPGDDELRPRITSRER